MIFVLIGIILAVIVWKAIKLTFHLMFGLLALAIALFLIFPGILFVLGSFGLLFIAFAGTVAVLAAADLLGR